MDEDNFHQLVDEWIEHCRRGINVSSPEHIRNCGAYKKIVAMGYEALPLIRQVYDKQQPKNLFGVLALSVVQGQGLVNVVYDIIGNDFFIPREIRGKTSEMKDYTKKWLDENMGRYLQTQ